MGKASGSSTVTGFSEAVTPTEESIEQQIRLRNEARAKKDFATADRIRQELDEKKNYPRRPTRWHHTLETMNPKVCCMGFHTVAEALQSPTRVIERLWLAKLGGRFSPLTHLAKERGIPFSVESRERLDRLAGDRHHQGVVANAAAKQYLDGGGIVK